MHQHYYLLQQLSNYRGVVQAISTKTAGDMEFKYGDAKNAGHRLRFLESLSVPVDRVVKMEQVHGTSIAFVSQDDVAPVDSVKAMPGVDGLITADRDVYLFVKTADCLPIIYFDPKEKIVGLAHAGWRGVVGKLPAMMIGAMVSQYGCEAKNIMVGIGPCLDKSANLVARPTVQEQLPEWRQFLNVEDERVRVDLVGFVLKQLIQMGVMEANIEVGGMCTAQQPDEFFSARNGDRGRFATIIGRR
jgi:YfiH family protein